MQAGDSPPRILETFVEVEVSQNGRFFGDCIGSIAFLSRRLGACMWNYARSSLKDSSAVEAAVGF